jgi:hypothetical protein
MSRSRHLGQIEKSAMDAKDALERAVNSCNRLSTMAEYLVLRLDQLEARIPREPVPTKTAQDDDKAAEANS